MSKTQQTALLEAGKELLRLILIAVISYLLSGVVLNQIINFFFFKYLSPEMTVVITGLVTVVLRTIEKYLHEAKSTNTVTEFLRFES